MKIIRNGLLPTAILLSMMLGCSSAPYDESDHGLIEDDMYDEEIMLEEQLVLEEQEGEDTYYTEEVSDEGNLDIISIGDQGDDNMVLPQRGSTMSTVIRDYGEPEEKYAPVGEPPITRWRYNSFTVVFEHSHVIHVVRHRN